MTWFCLRSEALLPLSETIVLLQCEDETLPISEQTCMLQSDGDHEIQEVKQVKRNIV